MTIWKNNTEIIISPILKLSFLRRRFRSLAWLTLSDNRIYAKWENKDE